MDKKVIIGIVVVAIAAFTYWYFKIRKKDSVTSKYDGEDGYDGFKGKKKNEDKYAAQFKLIENKIDELDKFIFKNSKKIDQLDKDISDINQKI